jgi:hypothetical protein
MFASLIQLPNMAASLVGADLKAPSLAQLCEAAVQGGQSFDGVWGSKPVDLNPAKFLGTTHFISCIFCHCLCVSNKHRG